MTVEREVQNVQVDAKDWQEIIAYIRALEERVMKLEAQQAMDEAERERADVHADLKGDGYFQRRPSDAAADIDAKACAESSCSNCGQVGLIYEPWVRHIPYSYRAYSVCPRCAHREEF